MIYTYSRVSTNSQQSSTEQQAEVLDKFCTRNNFTDVVNLVDTDVSAKIPVLKRPQGCQLINLKDGDSLVVSKHDRVFRNLEDAVVTVNKWFSMGVSIYLLNISDTPINMNNPTLKFQLYIMMASAEHERDIIAMRTFENKKFRKENLKTYGSAPYGWDNIGEKGANGKMINGRMEHNKYEQDVIAAMKDFRKEGKSYGYIARELSKIEVPTKDGKAIWEKASIHKILKNHLNAN